MSEVQSTIRLSGVKPAGDYCLRTLWTNGKEMLVNVGEVVTRLKGLRPLRNATVFARASVGPDGFSVTWPGDLDIGADRLYELALEQNGHADAAQFNRWRWKHGLSLTGAADALGIARRTVAYYSSGDQPVPRSILLACKGWESERGEHREKEHEAASAR